MALQLILGGSGRGKTYYLQHFISGEAKMFPNRKYIYVVPEQFTMQTQKAFVEISEKKGILNIDVQSFLRLAFRVLAETGFDHVPVLDDMGKTMVLKQVLEGMEEQLGYFGKNIHKKGYIQEIKSFLSELFQYGAEEETIEEMISAAGGRPLLVRKLTDMKLIYQKFTSYLKDHYITSEEILTVFSDVAQESELLRGSIICLDGFTGFTPTQYRLIGQLMKLAKKVYVTVTIDNREPIVQTGPKHALFYMSRKTICRLRKIAQENGIEVCTEIRTGIEKEKTRFADAEDICALETSLYRYPVQVYRGKPAHISLHILKQPEDELVFVAEQIRGLLLDRKCRYRDIAVVTGNLEVYGILAREIFRQAKIPCFIDQKKNILENPFVVLIDTALEVIISNFQADKVLTYEKNIFSQSTEEQNALLDNFLRATGIRGYRKWQEVWDCSKVFYGLEKEQLRYITLTLDTVRLETVEQLGELFEKFGNGKHSVREYAQSLCGWFEQQEYYFAIQRIAKEAQEAQDADTAGEYSQIYEIVLEVLDRLVELLGSEQMELKEFKEILDTGFSEARIGLIPPGVDQVVVGDMNRTRLSNIKYLFFLGMNDSNIPKNGSTGGILSDSERLFLTEEEFELAPTIQETIYTEQFYLYLSLTKASEHLFLSYCETGNDGKAQNPAYIVERIQAIFPDLVPMAEENRKDDRYLLGIHQGMDYLIQGLRNENYSDTKWQEIYRFYMQEEEHREELGKLVSAAFYHAEQTNLSRRVVRELYHDILTGSTSQFERYAACAFSYFMRYGLHLQERQEHQVEFFDIGNIVHEALELYTQQLLKEGKNWDEIPEKQQHARADACMDAVAEKYKNGLLYSTERDRYLITRLRRLLQRSIWAITRQMKEGSFRTIDSEIDFEFLHVTQGKELEGTAEREDTLRLIGRIDRIDAYTQSDTSYLKIVDYKTGKKTISLSDLYYGLQMQLIIYLKAGVEAQQRTKKLVIPAGMLYYNIDDPMIEGKASKEETEAAILRELRLDGLLNEDDPVLPAIDNSFATEGGGLQVSKTSVIAPFATNKDGTLKKTSKVVTTEEFSKLMDFTDRKLQEIRDEIMQGRIAVNPYRKADASGETGCMYCPYHGICGFDVRIQGNRYRILKKLSDDDVMQKIEQKRGEKDEA